MKVIQCAGDENIAMVYIGEFSNGKQVEFVESVQPPRPREDKWVFIISTLFGCPIGCKMCDAGGSYRGKLTEEQLLAQIDFMVRRRYPNGKIPSKQWKIQFARMGEPALNPNVLSLLEKLPRLYDAPGLMPSISTVAPHNSDRFFEKLMDIKNQHYRNGHFQLQFSIHTTDQKKRDQLIPSRKWDFQRIAEYGQQFFKPGDRKITLNFALARSYPIDPSVLLQYFDPSLFLIKLTPLNPTYHAKQHQLETYFKDESDADDPLIHQLRSAGYDVILSIGELQENLIGSNCGQYIYTLHKQENLLLEKAYIYQLQRPQ